MVERAVVLLLRSRCGCIILQDAGGMIVDVMVEVVARAVRCAAVVREFCAVQVVVKVVEDISLLVDREPVEGVLGYPVVGGVVGVAGVGGVSVVGVGGGWG